MDKESAENRKKLEKEKAEFVAEQLVDMANSYTVDYDSFANYICSSHRTLQQSVMRLFIKTICKMADVQADDRNYATVKLAKRIKDLAEDYPLPFI